MLALCSTPLALRVGSAARSGRGIVRMNANLPTTADVTDVREWLEEERSAEERAARAMQTAWRGLRFRRVTMQARVSPRLPEAVCSPGNSETPPLSQLIVELRRRRAILWLFARADGTELGARRRDADRRDADGAPLPAERHDELHDERSERSRGGAPHLLRRMATSVRLALLQPAD